MWLQPLPNAWALKHLMPSSPGCFPVILWISASFRQGWITTDVHCCTCIAPTGQEIRSYEHLGQGGRNCKASHELQPHMGCMPIKESKAQQVGLASPPAQMCLVLQSRNEIFTTPYDNNTTVGSTKDITMGSVKNIQVTQPLLIRDNALQPMDRKNTINCHACRASFLKTRRTASACSHFRPLPVCLSSTMSTEAWAQQGSYTSTWGSCPANTMSATVPLSSCPGFLLKAPMRRTNMQVACDAFSVAFISSLTRYFKCNLCLKGMEEQEGEGRF